MTGFRVHLGGAQALYGVAPDLTTLGKVIGGGLPVGAYGGRRDIMKLVAPSGPMYQAGTLSGNPLAMTRGDRDAEGARACREPGTGWRRPTRELAEGLSRAARAAGCPAADRARRGRCSAPSSPRRLSRTGTAQRSRTPPGSPGTSGGCWRRGCTSPRRSSRRDSSPPRTARRKWRRRSRRRRGARSREIRRLAPTAARRTPAARRPPAGRAGRRAGRRARSAGVFLSR